jgi:hypothetical protein
MGRPGTNKETTMKTTTRNTMTAERLTARMRNGRRRVEVLGWKRLAAIYYANKPGSAIRNAINAEARRCGYTPSTILAINAEE